MTKISHINSLKQKANALAKSYDDKGSIIISVDKDNNIRIGTDGLTTDEQRHALCVAVHYSFEFEEQP